MPAAGAGTTFAAQGWQGTTFAPALGAVVLTAFLLGFAVLSAFPQVMVTRGPEGIEWIIVADAYEDPETVRTVQVALILLDYDPGYVDGVLGAQTRKALHLYQKDHDLPTNGTPDPATLSALLDDLRVFEAIAALARLGEEGAHEAGVHPAGEPPLRVQ